MSVACDSCGESLEVAATAVPPAGTYIKCRHCQSMQLVKPEHIKASPKKLSRIQTRKRTVRRSQNGTSEMVKGGARHDGTGEIARPQTDEYEAPNLPLPRKRTGRTPVVTPAANRPPTGDYQAVGRSRRPPTGNYPAAAPVSEGRSNRVPSGAYPAAPSPDAEFAAAPETPPRGRSRRVPTGAYPAAAPDSALTQNPPATPRRSRRPPTGAYPAAPRTSEELDPTSADLAASSDGSVASGSDDSQDGHGRRSNRVPTGSFAAAAPSGDFDAFSGDFDGSQDFSQDYSQDLSYSGDSPSLDGSPRGRQPQSGAYDTTGRPPTGDYKPVRRGSTPAQPQKRPTGPKRPRQTRPVARVTPPHGSVPPPPASRSNRRAITTPPPPSGNTTARSGRVITPAPPPSGERMEGLATSRQSDKPEPPTDTSTPKRSNVRAPTGPRSRNVRARTGPRSRSHLAARQAQPPRQPPRDTRVPVHMAVRYMAAEEYVKQYAENLSRGGLFIAGAQTLPMGQRVKVEMELPGFGTFNVEAEVAHTIGAQEAHEQGRQPGAGMRIVDGPRGFQKALTAYLSRLGKRKDVIVYVAAEGIGRVLVTAGYDIRSAPSSRDLPRLLVEADKPIAGVVAPSSRVGEYRDVAAESGHERLVLEMGGGDEINDILAILDRNVIATQV